LFSSSNEATEQKEVDLYYILTLRASMTLLEAASTGEGNEKMLVAMKQP